MKLSIITINLNNFAGLQNTIESVLCQTFKDFEWIVIDGGSVDASLEIIRKYSNCFSYWVSESDGGIYNAQNKGIARTSGDYCYFLNSGDVLYNRETLENIFNQDLWADIITGNSYVREKDGSLHFVKSPKQVTFYTFYHHTILHQATLIRTNLFRKVGLYNENLKIVADWEFFVKALFLHQCTYQSLDLTVSVFDNCGISSNPENYNDSLKERKEVLLRYFPYFIEDYNLMSPRSTFIFLQNVKRTRLIQSVFILKSRIFNKIYRYLAR